MQETKINLNLRGKVWWYSYTVNGERYRDTTGIKESNPDGPQYLDRGKALLVAEKALKATLRGKSPFAPEQATAAILFEKYITRKVADGLSESTERNYRNYIAKFSQFFPANTKLSLLGREDMEDWKAFLLTLPVNCWRMEGRALSERFTAKGKPVPKKELNRKAKNKAASANNGKTLSPKTVKECLVFVAAVCNYFNMDNPLKSVKLPQKTKIEKQEELKVYTKEQVVKLLETAKTLAETKPAYREFYWWLVFILNTGCRIGEAQGIRIKDVNFEAGTVFLISRKRDEGRTIHVDPIQIVETTDENGQVLSEETKTDAESSPLFALSVLCHMANKHHGESLTQDSAIYTKYPQWFYKSLKNVSKVAQLPQLSPHALRHTFITLAMAQGDSLPKIAKFVGHRSIHTTFETYAHLSAEGRISLKLK